MRSLGSCPPPPRPFRLRVVDASTKFLLAFGGICAFVGCAVTLVLATALGPVDGDFTLDLRGVATQAMPVSVQPTKGRSNGRQVHRITYSFTDRAGVLHQASVDSTDGAIVSRARRHVPLSIEYDPKDPTLTRLKGASASPLGAGVLVPVFFAAAGGLILALGIRRTLRVRAVYVHGEAVRATVTAVLPSLMRLNRRRVMHVEYEFDTNFARVSGQATSLDPPAVGTRIWVIYVPADPERNVAVPTDA